jgi:hypothetical protein
VSLSNHERAARDTGERHAGGVSARASRSTACATTLRGVARSRRSMNGCLP